ASAASTSTRRRSGRADALGPTFETGATRSSTRLPQLPHEGQRPSHFPVVYPHSEQACWIAAAFATSRSYERDPTTPAPVTIPASWDGRPDSLSGGVVDALEEGFSDGVRANVLCALVAVVDPEQQGRGLSGHLIGGMAETAGRAGLRCLIAPVRPTWKERYPLVPIEEYMGWTRDDGLPFDPWIRL